VEEAQLGRVASRENDDVDLHRLDGGQARRAER
jgi:hypothetical protein